MTRKPAQGDNLLLAEKKYQDLAKQCNDRLLLAVTDKFGLIAPIAEIEAAEAKWQERMEDILYRCWKRCYELGTYEAKGILEAAGIRVTIFPYSEPLIYDKDGNASTLQEFRKENLDIFKHEMVDNPKVRSRMRSETAIRVRQITHDAFQAGHDNLFLEAQRWAQGVAASSGSSSG